MGLYLALLLFQVYFVLARSPPRVGVIGGGIGGSSAAYFISKQIPGSSITVFEMGKVGGRLATVTIDGREYETGGSIIHSANKYMVDYLDICGLKKKKGASEYGAGSGFTIHRDGEIVFQESTNFIMNTVKMIWRYGLWSLMKLDRFVTHVLDTFKDQIYPKLDRGQGFSSVSEFLEEVSPVSKYGDNSGEMLELTKISLWSQLVDRVGISPLLVEELGTVATRVNYGQYAQSMHAFVGSVGLAGTQGDLWAVEGGNYKVAECALEKAGAQLVLSQVVSVDRKNDKYLVTVRKDGGGSRRLNEEGDGDEIDEVEKDDDDDSEEKDKVMEFDIIVIASPQTKDKVRLGGNALKEVGKFPGKYHRTVATVVRGELLPSALNFTDLSSFTTSNFFLSPSNNLAAISKLSPVDYKGPEDDQLPPVYKMFSSRPLEKEDLDKLFTPIHKVIVEDWLAYPHYNYSQGTDLTNFTLSPGLYYTSRIEWAASAMEMSVIAAKNVANLATKFWMGSEHISETTDKLEKLEL